MTPGGPVPSSSWREFDVPEYDEPSNDDPLEDFRPPSDLKITRPVKGKHEVKFTKKQVKKGRYKHLSDFQWQMIHAKRKQIVDQVKNLLKPIRGYSSKNKMDLINTLGEMKEKVKQFY